MDSATRDIFLADDDVVDDVTSLSWYRSDRCSGSDGAIAIPVDGVGESLNIWQITKLTATVSHLHVKFVIIPRSLFLSQNIFLFVIPNFCMLDISAPT